METQTFSQDLIRYLSLLRRWTWLLVLAMVLAGSTAYVVSKRTIPVYQAFTTVLINEAPSIKSDFSSIQVNERLAKTYAVLMTTQPVLEDIVERMELDLDTGTLKEMISIQPVRETQLIELNVEDTDPVRAAQIANEVVTVFAEQNQALQADRYADVKDSLSTQLLDLDDRIQEASAELESFGDDSEYEIERNRLEIILTQYRQSYSGLLQGYEQVRLSEAQSTSNVVQVEPAIPPTIPIRPRVLQNTALAVIVGLMLAIGVVFLIEALDDTVKGPEDIKRDLGLPVLGLIAKIDENGTEMITVAQPRSPLAEAFRSLRTNILYASVDHPLQRLMITSPSSQEGKTTIAANLGVVTAQGGRRVILVDADLRHPSLHKKLRIPNRRGLSDLFVQPQVHLNGFLRKSTVPDLFILPSGYVPPNPADLLGSEKMQEVLHTLKNQADLVIVDTPAAAAVTDPSVLASHMDGVLLVVRPGVTKLALLQQSVEQLRRSGATLLGVVLNDVENKRSRYNYYYKGYYTDNYYMEMVRMEQKKGENPA